jgi:hypothetical protein
MTKTFLTVAVIGSVCGFAGLAFAQGKQDEPFGSTVSSLCAQMKDPKAKDDCVREQRKEAGLGSERSWQGGNSASSSSQGVGSSGMGSGGGPGMGAGKSRR